MSVPVITGTGGGRTEGRRYVRESGGAHGAALLEAFAAEYRAALGGTEGYRRFLSALGTIGFGLGAHRGVASSPATAFGALGLASLAALGLVLEALVGKKHLFARCKNKLGATLRTLQNLVVVFHEPLSLDPEGAGRRAHLAPWAWEHGGYPSRGESRGIPWASGHEAATETQTSLPWGA